MCILTCLAIIKFHSRSLNIFVEEHLLSVYKITYEYLASILTVIILSKVTMAFRDFIFY